MPDQVFARTPRQFWALPGGRHDKLVKSLRVVLPMTIGVLAAGLVMAPLLNRAEISILLDKNKVSMATERMKVIQALYRGEDSQGQPFSLSAGSAVQASSKDPVVRLNNMKAEIDLPEGPASLTAVAGRYNMDTELVNVDGPVTFQTSDGYRLSTRDVEISLKGRRIASSGPVQGVLPLGSFSAGRITADLANRSVMLTGGAHLQIVQGGIR